MATIQDIQSIASLIKNATEAGENTAERVGGLFENIAQILQQHETNIGEKGDKEVLETVKSTADAAKLKAEQAQTSADNAQSAIDSLKKSFETLVSGDASIAIDNYNEIIKFLDGLKDTDNLSSILTQLNLAINKSQSEITNLDTSLQDVTNKFNALDVPKLAHMTESAYEALADKDDDTYYFLTED